MLACRQRTPNRMKPLAPLPPTFCRPGRISRPVSVIYSREDRARFMGMDSAHFEMNLVAMRSPTSWTSKSSTGDEGLLNGSQTWRTTTSARKRPIFALYLTQFGLWPCRWRRMPVRRRRIFGWLSWNSATYAHMGGTYRTGTTPPTTLVLERLLVAITGGIKVSAHVPGPCQRPTSKTP